MHTGVTYSSPMPGLVPEIEEREACRWNGYTWRQWEGLPRLERVNAVAHFRLANIIDLNQQDAVLKEQERRARQRS